MHKVYLLIGGNMGNREENLDKAVKLLVERAGSVTGLSAVFETAAWGITDQPSFLNQAVAIDTTLSPDQLLQTVLEIERALGRIRKQKNGPRIIDIDILFYDDLIIQQKHLTVPHPEIQNRRFALAPLQNLAPEFVHPVFRKSISELFDECPDTLPVFIHISSKEINI
ncbi:MAG: 2-amino-4-hydroxy-6-hydroxymethyldihydropteridine diphosphokinase [Chitinophagaceae bacterium]|nr:MAG: 2-amino-4-hydroxy-6-hydroxymethyldihydropteridine diphosphokinase [Chitinophagaceae bacterium]